MRGGFLPNLTLLFIALKMTEVIAWSWWLVLSPLIVAPFIYALLIMLYKAIE